MGGERDVKIYDLRMTLDLILLKVRRLQVHCTMQWVMSFVDFPTNSI